MPCKLAREDRVAGTMRLVFSQGFAPEVFDKGATLAVKERNQSRSSSRAHWTRSGVATVPFRPFRLAADDFNTVLGIVREMDRLRNAPHPRPGMRFLAVARFMALIARVLDAYERTADSGVTENVPHRLGALAARMEQHCADRFTVKAMCREAGMSYASLFRCFRRYYRDSPVNYLLKQRLRRAEELLRQAPERSIGEIALACGFSDSAYFARKFHEHYQMPPSVYRRKLRVNAAPGKDAAALPPDGRA